MKKIFILFVVICNYNCDLYSQNRTIFGKVITEYLETVTSLSIMIKDTVEVGNTDLNGFFHIDIPTSENELSFISLGLEPTTIELVDNCDEIEVVIMYDTTYHFITLKRAERKRKKRFKSLPEIHKQAFEKGIFNTEYACYKRDFQPLYLEAR